MKKRLGCIAALLAMMLTIYLVLGICTIVPLTEYRIFSESLVRFLAECAVICYLVAAWAFWEV